MRKLKNNIKRAFNPSALHGREKWSHRIDIRNARHVCSQLHLVELVKGPKNRQFPVLIERPSPHTGTRACHVLLGTRLLQWGFGARPKEWQSRGWERNPSPCRSNIMQN